MKLWLLFVSVVLVASAGGCKSQPAFQDPFTRPQIYWEPHLRLTTDQAERILGNLSRLEKTTAYDEEDGTKAFQASFRDDLLDPMTGKTGILYFMYEEYQSAKGAKEFLDLALKSNHANPEDGIRTKNGAELHYLTGGMVVRMAMILKEDQLIRLKVNQLTSHYRLDEFQRVAEELAGQL